MTNSTNTTAAQLQFVNTQITNPRLINVGSIIKIPNSAFVAPASAPSAEPTTTCSDWTAYTVPVVSGDTSIITAKENLGTTSPSLLATNLKVTILDVIHVGYLLNTRLCGKNGTTTPSTATSKPTSVNL